MLDKVWWTHIIKAHKFEEDIVKAVAEGKSVLLSLCLLYTSSFFAHVLCSSFATRMFLNTLCDISIALSRWI